MSSRELYAYSTKKYLCEGLIKVGDSQTGRYLTRIKEQVATSHPEEPIPKLIGELPEGKRDYHVHEQLIKNGIKRADEGPGREWFYATFDDVRKAYNQLVFGSARKHNFSLRSEQVDAVAKAKKWFLKEYPAEVYESACYKNVFLMYAKMRFGKCFTTINLAKAIGASKTLVVTYKPDVIDEWMDTVNEHIFFEGWTGIRARKKNKRLNDPILNQDGSYPGHDGPIVLCVSLQDLNVAPDRNTKARLKSILAISWDLVIFDEVHFGGKTARAEFILDNIKHNYLVELSGTPFRIIEREDYSCQQVYTYGYLDEQHKKKEEINKSRFGDVPYIYRQLPDLNISTIEITEEDVEQQLESFSTDDLDFSLNRLFETNEGSFVYEDAVDHFIEGLTRQGHEARAISVFGKLGSELGVPSTRHTVWWLNRVESVSALVKKLHKHPYFSKFEIIDASGSGSIQYNDRVVAREKSVIQESIEKVNLEHRLGTITLTCGRFLTGVTIREWDSILVLNDIQSAETYFQAIFRVQSSWLDDDYNLIFKPKAWVFDFSISRCLKIIYDCANSISDQLDQQKSYETQSVPNEHSLETTLTGLCETLDIKRFIEGSLKSDPVTSKEIFEALNFEGSRLALARRITSNQMVDFAALKLLDTHPHLLKILESVKGYRTQDVGLLDLNKFIEIGVDAEKLDKIKKDLDILPEEKEKMIDDFIDKERDKKKQKRKKWYATQIKRLSICMADFIYMTFEREYNIDQVIQTESAEFFIIMTGISKQDFSELFKMGFLNRHALNRIVKEFFNQETSSLFPEEYIYENLKNNINNIE